MADNLEQLQALRKAVEKLLCALQMHHQWHTNAGEMGICKDGAAEWIVLDMSVEYGGSTMHEVTIEALSFAKSVRGVNE